MWEPVIQAFGQAAAANRALPLRRGNVVHLPTGADWIVTGDLHGHGANILRIEALADLDRHRQRHVMLQELIHPSNLPDDSPRGDYSHLLVSRAARWQLSHPGRVHVILGNHELAQMTGQDILKGGTSICRRFEQGVRDQYTDEADAVLAAIYDYFRSLPLAVRSADGLVGTHSLPADRDIAAFDATIFERPAVPADFTRSGPVYQLVWGRTIGRASVDRMRQLLDARAFVLGHRPQPTGFAAESDDVLVLASDHNAGVALLVAPGPPPPAAELARRLVRLSGVRI